jgi:EAL and modified HD-GYP domain-containing signal transduction protein
MASEIKSPLDSSIAFLTGLLSLIDAIVDEDLAHILTKLPLAQEIKDTLLTRKGDMAALIMLLEFIERAEWSKTNVVMTKLGLTKASVLKSYNEAIAWADEQKRADY